MQATTAFIQMLTNGHVWLETR